MAVRRWGMLLVLVLLQPGCVLTDNLHSGTAKTPADETLLPGTESARACQAVAATLAQQGHAEQAINELLKARAYDPRCDVSPALGRLYAKTRNDRLAQDEFAKAIAAHPKDADLYNDLGYFHYQRGNWAEAHQNLQKAVEIAPKHARAWMNLGLTLGQENQYAEALAAFEKAVRPAEVRCNLAFVVSTHGQFDEARKLYHEALQLDPGLKLARAALERMDRPGRAAVAPGVAAPPNRLELPQESQIMPIPGQPGRAG